jgi:hypothetical protein
VQAPSTPCLNHAPCPPPGYATPHPLKVTFVEIYQEAVYDLLAPGPGPCSTGGSAASLASAASSGGLWATGGGGFGSGPVGGAPGGGGITIREGPRGAVVLEGATEAVAGCKEDVIALVARGNERRATGGHKLNEASSRSHAVLALTLEQRARPGAGVPSELRLLRSKLALVDLAGSERAKQTGATGARFQEGVSINSGLLALGNVINALAQQQQARAARLARARSAGGGGAGGAAAAAAAAAAARRHIPYRDSKLTRILQDGLGGNSETLFIACVSPSDAAHEHTLGTLRYAGRAALISNSLQLGNAVGPEDEAAFLRSALEAAQGTIKGLRAEVAALRAEVARLAAAGAGGAAGAGATPGRR